jgi:hypothetical protein
MTNYVIVSAMMLASFLTIIIKANLYGFVIFLQYSCIFIYVVVVIHYFLELRYTRCRSHDLIMILAVHTNYCKSLRVLEDI